MSRSSGKQRVIVYIDGYNLYYGLRAAFDSKYKWLDLQALSEDFLRPGAELAAVKYFTSVTKGISGPKRRQAIYLKALKTHCNKLETFYGRFLKTAKRCPSCGANYQVFEEKKTDVNLACEMLNDAHLDRYDCCYVVSGDSDLVPPIEIIRRHHPKKRIVVALPPMRKSEELCRTAQAWFAISRQTLSNSLLPEQVTSIHGGKMIRPTEWK